MDRLAADHGRDADEIKGGGGGGIGDIGGRWFRWRFVAEGMRRKRPSLPYPEVLNCTVQ